MIPIPCEPSILPREWEVIRQPGTRALELNPHFAEAATLLNQLSKPAR